MHNEDKRVKHKAIELWTKSAAAAYGKDGAFTTSQPPGKGRADPEAAARFLDDSNREMEQMKQEIVTEHHDRGCRLPPLTEAELNAEWFFRYTEPLLDAAFRATEEELAQ